MSRPDVLVVGGGIVGAACARALAAEGRAVAVVESRFVGAGATAAGMGHIIVVDDSPAQFRLTRWSQQLWSAIAPELPASAQVDGCGCIWVAADDEDMAAVNAKAARYREHGVAVEILDAAALSEAEPNLRAGLLGGLRMVEDSIVYPPVAANWMLEHEVGPGSIRVLSGQLVVRIDGRGLQLADGKRMEAEWVVNAAGEAALGLLPGAVPGTLMRPRKGHLAITSRVPGFCHHQLVELGYLKSAHSDAAASVAFNLQPRPTGQLLLGSSRQYEFDGDAVELPVLARMFERAIAYVPGIAALDIVRTWTGFRATTPDKLPLLGPVPGVPGLLLATGHEGLGITTSLATGRMIADWVAGRDSEIPRRPYMVTRYLEAA